MIELIGGSLWQWDTDRQIKIDIPGCNFDQAQFWNGTMEEALVVEVTTSESGDVVANIPNILLQSPNKLIVYVCSGGCKTEHRTVFHVTPRAKPTDYIYTETDVLTWSVLDRRIDELEKNQDPNAIKDAVNEYLRENPPEGFITDESLSFENGVLSVNTASEVETDNTLPVTSAAVATTVGNIEILLKTI